VPGTPSGNKNGGQGLATIYIGKGGGKKKEESGIVNYGKIQISRGEGVVRVVGGKKTPASPPYRWGRG